MDIDDWLEKFEKHWKTHNINGILNLFDKNVIYFETPFFKLENFGELAEEWKAIKNQNEIYLDFEIFSSYKNKHSIIWKLRYSDKTNTEKIFSGTYLIKLNNKGICTYFHHSCESM